MDVNTLLRYDQFGPTLRDFNLRIARNRVPAINQNDQQAEDEQKLSDSESHSAQSDSVLISKEAMNLAKNASQASSHNFSDLLKISDEEEEEAQNLEERDREVKKHEQAHVQAGGQYTSQPMYEYEIGPDGKRYAVGGHVSIDTSSEDTPEKTIQKAQTIKNAALAPENPSTEDRQVAAKAEQMIQEAYAEKETEELPQQESVQSEAIIPLQSSIHTQSVHNTEQAHTATQTIALERLSSAYNTTISQRVNLVA